MKGCMEGRKVKNNGRKGRRKEVKRKCREGIKKGTRENERKEGREMKKGK